MLTHIRHRLCRRIGFIMAALTALLVSNPAAVLAGEPPPARRPGYHAPHSAHGPNRIGHHTARFPQGQPRIGHHAARSPQGRPPIRIGAAPYFFHAVRPHRPARRGYVHVRPPVGALLAALPLGFLTLTLGSLVYFHHGDVYYRRVPAGYRVVEAPREVVVVRETPPSDAPIAAQNGDAVVVTAPRLNVRNGPAGSFGVIAIVDRGVSLDVRGTAPDWLYVRLADGRHGWVQEVYTTPIVPLANG